VIGISSADLYEGWSAALNIRSLTIAGATTACGNALCWQELSGLVKVTGSHNAKPGIWYFMDPATSLLEHLNDR
jgi:hypothetical protein